MSDQPTPLKVGDLLNLAEADYLYGSGALKLRVVRVHDSQPMAGWLQVTGIAILWNGNRGDERTVFVRQEAFVRVKARGTR